MEYGLSTAQGYSAPLFVGLGVGGGAHRLSSTSVSRLICAGWCRMTGLRNEERCRSLASSVARAGRSQCSLGSLLASLRRCALLAEPLVVAATPSSRATSNGPRARAPRPPRRSSGACLG